MRRVINRAQNHNRQQPTNARASRLHRPFSGDFSAVSDDKDVGCPFRKNGPENRPFMAGIESRQARRNRDANLRSHARKPRQSVARSLPSPNRRRHSVHKHRRRNPHNKRQIPPIRQPLKNHRALRTNRFHDASVRAVEKANHKTEIQGKRRFLRLRLSAAKRLRHLGLRVHTDLQKRKTPPIRTSRPTPLRERLHKETTRRVVLANLDSSGNTPNRKL